MDSKAGYITAERTDKKVDAYEYVTYFLQGDYISSLGKSVSAYWLRRVLQRYRNTAEPVTYWNQLINYFILPSESPGEFQNLEEFINWIDYGHS